MASSLTVRVLVLCEVFSNADERAGTLRHGPPITRHIDARQRTKFHSELQRGDSSP